MYFLKCCKNSHYNTTSVIFVQFLQTNTSTLQVYCNTSMHLYYEFVASINVYIQHATEWSVEVYRQTQARDAAPLSRFPSFLPHRFRALFFVCFISIWASRALVEPLRRGVASEGSWGGPRGHFWGHFGHSWSYQVTSSIIWRASDWRNERIHELWNFCMCLICVFTFLRSLHWPFCIVRFAGGGWNGWRKARFARARREVKLENFACKIYSGGRFSFVL